MRNSHYLHQKGNIQVEFSIEAEPNNQTAIVVKEGNPKKLSVHEVRLHSSVDFPEHVQYYSRSFYYPTLASMPIILDRLHTLCEEYDVELVEFIYALTPEEFDRIQNHS